MVCRIWARAQSLKVLLIVLSWYCSSFAQHHTMFPCKSQCISYGRLETGYQCLCLLADFTFGFLYAFLHSIICPVLPLICSG
jgi:hypothetical protein